MAEILRCLVRIVELLLHDSEVSLLTGKPEWSGDLALLRSSLCGSEADEGIWPRHDDNFPCAGHFLLCAFLGAAIHRFVLDSVDDEVTGRGNDSRLEDLIVLRIRSSIQPLLCRRSSSFPSSRFPQMAKGALTSAVTKALQLRRQISLIEEGVRMSFSFIFPPHGVEMDVASMQSSKLFQGPIGICFFPGLVCWEAPPTSQKFTLVKAMVLSN